MLRKAFYALLMGIDGVAGFALGAFALTMSGKWTMELIDEGQQKVKKFIHDKTAEPKCKCVERSNEETDGE